jgi:acetolactate synthase-1/2/3 large subunit
MTGADLIVKAFLDNGVDKLFLYPGGTIAPILEVAKHYAINFYVGRHEQGAGYAALGYARLSKCPQVIMVTSGPGVTNLVTTVADAYFDSVPLVVICGQVGTGDLKGNLPLRQRGFQEVDTVSIMRPICKAVWQPSSASSLYEVISRAFFECQNGRPGPIVIDMPMNFQRESVDKFESFLAPQQLSDGSMEAAFGVAWKLITNSKKPVFLAGQGLLSDEETVELFRGVVSALDIPVSHSLLGLGALSGQHRLNLGFHGHTGNRAAGHAIYESDLIIAIGTRLDIRQTGSLVNEFAPNASIIRVDIDSSELSHSRIRSDLIFKMSAKNFLFKLQHHINLSELPDRQEWLSRVFALKHKHHLPTKISSEGALKPQYLIEKINQITLNQDVNFVSGVGSHQQWVARHIDFDYPKRQWFTSGGHGAMGFDLPVAAGVSLARPNLLTLCVVGDASFQINLQELGFITEHKLNVKIVILDNNRFGIVSQFQNITWSDDPVGSHRWNPDFCKIASGYSMPAFSLNDYADVDQTLDAFFAVKGPALLHCKIDPAEDIKPMLLSGKPMNEMWPYHED